MSSFFLIFARYSGICLQGQNPPECFDHCRRFIENPMLQYLTASQPAPSCSVEPALIWAHG
jgi:hypothetical protein